MPLPSFLQRKPDPQARRGAACDDGAGPVEAARTRARRRLIGAVVLLAAGVVVFPLVFETQPRPLAVNVPIEVPARKDGGVVAGARPAAAKPLPLPAEAPVEAAPPASAAAPAAKPDSPPETKAEARSAPAPAAASKPAPKPSPAEKPAEKAAEPADRGDRAKALLDGKPAAPAAAGKDGRFVVQVGAYSDADALREARQRVERLGLKTYTQVVETEAGKRTRVRIGPFATREEAERAAARIKGAALPAAVLTL
jgi:DedD protein